MNTYNLPWHSGISGSVKLVTISGVIVFATICEIKQSGKTIPDITHISKIDRPQNGVSVYGIENTNQHYYYQYQTQARLVTIDNS